jgi:Mg2+ and Co2+ transporter CorA
MKAITLLTMAFLPATFVATIFSLNGRNEMELKVAPQVWMYVVVTVPLTLLVLGVCALWLRWNDKKFGGDKDRLD